MPLPKDFGVYFDPITVRIVEKSTGEYRRQFEGDIVSAFVVERRLENAQPLFQRANAIASLCVHKIAHWHWNQWKPIPVH